MPSFPSPLDTTITLNFERINRIRKISSGKTCPITALSANEAPSLRHLVAPLGSPRLSMEGLIKTRLIMSALLTRDCKLCETHGRGRAAPIRLRGWLRANGRGWLTWLRIEAEEETLEGEDDARRLVIGTADAEEASFSLRSARANPPSRELNLRRFYTRVCWEGNWLGGERRHWFRDVAIFSSHISSIYLSRVKLNFNNCFTKKWKMFDESNFVDTFIIAK